MNVLTRTSFVLASALALSTAAPAAAQDISSQDVRTYFQEFAREANKAMGAGEHARVLELLNRHFADGAVIQANIAIFGDDERKGNLAVTLDKDDILAMGGTLLALVRNMDMKDFALKVEVLDVDPHGTGAATATTRWTESFTIASPAEAGAEGKAEPITVEEVLDCTQVVQRVEGRLQMGLMTCTGEIDI